MMSQLANVPFIRWMMRHPRLAGWIVLSLGMVILLVIEARDVGLLVTQWIALIVATILVAGACVWIVSWEDKDEEPDGETKPDTKAEAAEAEKPEQSSV